MILVILAIYFGYKKAKETGRNPFLWAFIASAAFIGTQFLVAFGLYILLAVAVEGFGWAEESYARYEMVVNLISIVASFISLYLVFRYLDRVPEQESDSKPPPPPEFKINQS